MHKFVISCRWITDLLYLMMNFRHLPNMKVPVVVQLSTGKGERQRDTSEPRSSSLSIFEREGMKGTKEAEPKPECSL